MTVHCTALAYAPDIASHYFQQIRTLPWAVWLDSCNKTRFDILSAAPQQQFITQQHNIDPHHELKQALGSLTDPIEHFPFTGGIIGFWGYELAHSWHKLPTPKYYPQTLAAWGLYDWAIIIDHQQKTANLVSQQRFPETAACLAQVRQLLQQAPIKPQTFQLNTPLEANFTASHYQQAFAKIQAYLHEGDCYQVNLAQCFSAQAQGDALSPYLALRQQSPAPYSAFLDFPQMQILSVSPEQFLSINQGQVSTKPIKGTRPRHTDPLQDASLKQDLAQHPKDRAENLMIVDLLRNDLNKHCLAGSVKTPKLFDIESYANVHHLVSTVTGQLKPNSHPLDLLRDSFPGGSITGAPKLRAMQIIQELEPATREVYCGAIGYLGFDGNMETNIAIRTLVYDQQTIRCWAGGGIVADSECAGEYQETFDKASAMLQVLRSFQQ